MYYTANDYFDYRIDDSQNRLNWGSAALKPGWDSQWSPDFKSSVHIHFVPSGTECEKHGLAHMINHRVLFIHE